MVEFMSARLAQEVGLDTRPMTMLAFGTPRRLALAVLGLPVRQPDVTEEVLGPPASAAFDRQGVPTKAALGFAKGKGKDEIPEGLLLFEAGPLKTHGELFWNFHLGNFFLNLSGDGAKISSARIGRHVNDPLLIFPLQLDWRKDMFQFNNIFQGSNPVT
jgi:hypothetical protein